MNNYSQQQLDQKIKAFMTRKTEQYPELMRTKQAKHVVAWSRFESVRLFSPINPLNPQLLR